MCFFGIPEITFMGYPLIGERNEPTVGVGWKCLLEIIIMVTRRENYLENDSN